jgi:hypothetical protein
MYLPYDNDGNFWVKPIDYLKYGKITTKSLSYFDKVYINDIMVQDLKECFVDVKMIDENLYMNTCLSPDDKWVERVKRGVFYKDPIRLI